MEGGLVTLANIIAKLKCAALRPDLDLGDKTSKWSVRVEHNQMKLQHAARSDIIRVRKGAFAHRKTVHVSIDGAPQ